MDNLFSFPSATLGRMAPLSDTASEAPGHAPSNEVAAAASESVDAEEIENVRATSSSEAADSDTLHVRLKLLDERVFDVHVERDLPVAEFRAKVEQATEIPAQLQRLIYRGKLLKDGTLLSSYDVQDGHMIHLVSKPVTTSTPTPSSTSATTSTATSTVQDYANGESTTLNRFVGRSRERLRQTMREEQAHQQANASGLREPGMLRPQPMTSTRIRRPGTGDLTGDAWNLAVLREALGQQSDRMPATPSNNALPGYVGESQRQGHEQRQMAQNDAPADVAADMGLSGTSANVAPEQPSLDHLTQSILTLRTVLSTAAVPDESLRPHGDATVTTGDAVDASSSSVNAVQDDVEQGHTTGTPTEEQHEPTAEMSLEVTSPVSPRGFHRGRRRFFVGQWLDVKDTVNQWLECTVMDMSEDKVLVHYHGWPSRWDEWIDFDSDRIAAFRTRTQHTLSPQQMTPAPSTRLPNAPPVGENDMRRIVPQLRDLMEEVLPYVNQLATLCERDVDNVDEDADRHREELSEMAHLVTPFFDRFGRLLVDSARQMDAFMRPELRHDERRRHHQQRTRGSGSNRQAQTENPEDSAINVRDLITTAVRPPQDAQAGRRSIDVHIHAIVAPSSLSSLASLARLGTAIAGAIGSGSSRNNPPALQSQRESTGSDLEEAFGLPRLRPLHGATDRSLLNDSVSEPEDEEDSRYRDTSRTPLLSSFRRSPGHPDSTPRPRRLARESSSSNRLADFLSDDFFGPSFSQDSDDMDDPLGHEGFGANDHSSDDLVQYQEIPSPRENSSSDDDTPSESDTPRIGVIPEIEEAERRERERQQDSGDAGRGSSSSSSTSSYPTFLEVMRRTLSGVRNFGFSSARNDDEAAQPTRSDRSDSISSSSSASSSSDMSISSGTSDDLPPLDPMTPRDREVSSTSLSSVEEDLDSVD